MDDLINRQAVIDAIKRCESTDTYDFNNGMIRLIRALNAIADIPSAQPDIVRCKDCKNSSGKIANRTKCGLHNWWVGFDYFCADGERKEAD